MEVVIILAGVINLVVLIVFLVSFFDLASNVKQIRDHLCGNVKSSVKGTSPINPSLEERESHQTESAPIPAEELTEKNQSGSYSALIWIVSASVVLAIIFAVISVVVK